MSNAYISDELKVFIFNNFDTIGQLEVLLLLHSAKETTWTANSVSKQLRSSEVAAVTQLEFLVSRGFIIQINSEIPKYIYSLSDERDGKFIDELARIYPTYKVSILSWIYDKKTEMIRSFSDAFKIKKDT